MRPDAASVDEDGAERSRGPVATALGLLVLAWGAAISAYPLTDNSFLTHLATGRLILERGSVPSSDPYTFTAPGTDWTVQSWLASVAYAGAEQVAATAGLRGLLLLVYLAAAALVWRLSRPCTALLPRIAVAFGAMYVAVGAWSERPYMVGVIALGVVWLALDGRTPPWTLVPLYWVWTNTHGSFPLGVLLAVSVLVGARLDRQPSGRELRVVLFSLLGTVAGAIGPLGIRALSFPFEALRRSDVLAEIVEWQPPAYRDLDERLFLVMVAAVMAALVRRPRWRLALPAVAFSVAAIVAQRNIPMAVIVLVPVLSHGLGDLGSLRVDGRPALGRAYVLVGAVALVAAVGYAVSAPFGDLEQYPVRPLAWVGPTGQGTRLAGPDVVGNFLEAVDGDRASVFIDDRVDMLPEDVVADGFALLRAEADWASVLRAHDIDLVVWERKLPLGSLLAVDPDWRIVFSDTDWFLACRRATSCQALEGDTIS